MVTFVKLRTGRWGIKSTAPVEGTVDITTKLGKAATVEVGRCIWSGNGVYLYSIVYRCQGCQTTEKYVGRDGYCDACRSNDADGLFEENI